MKTKKAHQALLKYLPHLHLDMSTLEHIETYRFTYDSTTTGDHAHEEINL